MREPREAEVMRRAVKAGITTVQTALPGIIKTFDPITKTATVEPAVSDGNPIPPLPDVPVKFPSGGLYRMVWLLMPGDECTLIFYKTDPSRFRASGTKSNANLKREHGYYPVCIPGSESDVRQALMSPPVGMHLGTIDGLTDIVISPAGIALVSAAGISLTSLAPIKLGSDLASLPVANGAAVDAYLAALVTYISTHVHTAAGTGPPAAPPPAPTPTSSARAFVDG